MGSESIFREFDRAVAFDWEGLSELPVWEARLAAAQALRSLEGIEETVFHLRMRIFRVVRRLELWRDEIDPEVGQPFASMRRWIMVLFPRAWRYAKDAWEAEEANDAVPISDLTAMSAANVKVLAQVSSNLRTMPDVIQAAKTLTKDGFLEVLNRDHHQHLEPVTVIPKADSQRFEEALRFSIWRGASNRAEAVLDLAESYIDDFRTQYEEWCKMRESA